MLSLWKVNQAGVWARPLSDARLNVVDFKYPAFLVDFSDALRALKENRKVYRPYWTVAYNEPVGRYLTIWQGYETEPMLMVMMPDENLTPFSGSHRDLLAEDWEIYNDPELQ